MGLPVPGGSRNSGIGPVLFQTVSGFQPGRLIGEPFLDGFPHGHPGLLLPVPVHMAYNLQRRQRQEEEQQV
jgi:hypothetical protein